ncbi:MAG: DUF3783 domain-containing protein [Lachnospiraceae bacterium]|nr:DUF3783 domain-containing protein [Lachnospiraceae bacterium]
MKTQKQILFFSLERKKASRIQEVCSSLGIQTKTVSGNQYDCSLGYLAGIAGVPAHGQDDGDTFQSPLLLPVMTEMMVFSGITSEELDTFLDAYRAAGIPPIALKAILTPTNVFWSAKKLYRELQAEHLRMSK